MKYIKTHKTQYQKNHNLIKNLIEDLNRHFSSGAIQIVNKYIKMCLTLLIIRKMQVKNHNISSHLWECLLSKRQDISIGKDVEKRKSMYTAGGNAHWYSCYGKNYGSSSKNWKTTIWSSNSTSEYLSERKKKLIWKDSCTLMFNAVQFTIANTCKQPKCLLIDEYVRKGGLLLSPIKVGNPDICTNMGGSWRQYAKWYDRHRKKNTIWSKLYVESKNKWIKTNQTKSQIKNTKKRLVGSGWNCKMRENDEKNVNI